MSVSSRYECTVCHNHFCIDCDLFAHEVVHNCPGCQSGNPRSRRRPADAKTTGDTDADAMDTAA
jgi:transcription initiation factor TFIIH subunit 2